MTFIIINFKITSEKRKNMPDKLIWIKKKN